MKGRERCLPAVWLTQIVEGLAMRGTRSATSQSRQLAWLGLCIAAGYSAAGGLAWAGSPPENAGAVAVGYEIFNREWMPGDPRSMGGDGLGPVYNDTSCVACHNAAGSGGAGPVSKNIDILSASVNMMLVTAPANGQAEGQPKASPFEMLSAARLSELPRDPLTDLHAGFQSSRTVVLHKFGVDPNYGAWRSDMLSPRTIQNGPTANEQALTRLAELQIEVEALGSAAPAADQGRGSLNTAAAQIHRIRAAVLVSSAASRQKLAAGQFLVTRSQRNPAPVFGLGLIDGIPDEAIEEMAKREREKSPRTAGRVSRLKDGRIGRLGWKAQTANVEDFVLNACAVELGLEVPGHHQAISPQAPKYRAPGLDLTSGECAALVAYVRSLPKPVERRPLGAAEAKQLEAGKAAFSSISCAGCHAPKLGDITGIYSDLLLHDMGQDTADDGSYIDDGSDDPLVPDGSPIVAAKDRTAKHPALRAPRVANRREWRTPPLWGFRDSGPYLHDGRAQTLEEAVALHGGQGEASAQKFFELTPRERLQVEAFLKSLVAPPAVQLAARGG
jgi:CxxC motif-containing protein (DUF1111 family)